MPMTFTTTIIQRARLLAMAIALPAGLLAWSGIAQADPHHGGHGGHGNDYHGDGWYRPGVVRVRPSIGVSVNVLPPAPRMYAYGREHFYYAAGAWYRPYGPRFVVVAPPIGIVVPFLPTYYDSRVIRGETYYLSDGTYYRATPRGDGYIVSAPPSDASDSAPVMEKSFVYPRNGQSEKQQDKDSYECHAWAVNQSGFDPTQAYGGVSADQVAGKSSDYRRANEACMDGRGYTVK
ncbi:DUF6515 family protein [Uliginosibacterium sp. H3]|uniref:DUF6515 family protein n=1 Tax=Uliginosibacterium silvisoli TaxID=3114758 RepID=A0ABU6K4B5_9RHOO|nr:DUF6515 family protein [Uliginosibacterium sp. H3]